MPEGIELGTVQPHEGRRWAERIRGTALGVSVLSALSLAAEAGVYYLEGQDMTEPVTTGMETSLGVFAVSLVIANAAHAFTTRGVALRSEPRYVDLDILDPTKRFILPRHLAR